MTTETRLIRRVRVAQKAIVNREPGYDPSTPPTLDDIDGAHSAAWLELVLDDGQRFRVGNVVGAEVRLWHGEGSCPTITLANVPLETVFLDKDGNEIGGHVS